MSLEEFIEFWKSLNPLEVVDMREVYEVYLNLDENMEVLCHNQK